MLVVGIGIYNNKVTEKHEKGITMKNTFSQSYYPFLRNRITFMILVLEKKIW